MKNIKNNYNPGLIFLTKNIKKLKFIYLIKKEETQYITWFNDEMQKMKSKEAAQAFIDEQYQIVNEEIESIKEAYEEEENEEEQEL